MAHLQGQELQILDKPQEAGGGKEGIFLCRFQRERGLANTLILGLRPSELSDRQALLF